MDDDTAKKLLKRLHISASFLRIPYEKLDDCVQAALLKYLQGQGAHQTTTQALIDEIRKAEGSSRNKTQRLFMSLEDVKDLEFDSENSKSGLVEDFISLLDKIEIEPLDRALFLLHHGWGLTYQELADCFKAPLSSLRLKIVKVSEKLREIL